MKTASIPDNEQARLAALARYEILDSAPEPGFDNLTRIAATLLDAPIALVSIVDERRAWFKSHYGLEAPELARDVSFCGHVVADDAPLVLPDTHADERFADHPLVLGSPQVRFYAGIPLRTPDGLTLGTLCVLDHRPRQISAAQQQILADLAEQVVALLELRRSALRLRVKAQRLAAFGRYFELSLDLFCTANAQLHFVELNPAWTSALGWSLDELRARPYTELVHPDDLQATLAEAQHLQDGAVTVDFENRYRHRDGRWVPLSWTARVHGDLVFASARDLTRVKAQAAELAEALAELRGVFDAMGEGVVVHALGTKVTAANRSAAAILGLTEDQLLGRSSFDPRWGAMSEDGSPLSGEQHPSAITLRTGEPRTDMVIGVRKASGELVWIAVNSRALSRPGEAAPYGAVVTFRDVTRLRELAERDARLAQQERLVTTGTLAAGVGHEINNPLSYIMSNLEFALEELDGGPTSSPEKGQHEVIAALRAAMSGVDSIQGIVGGLRALAREDDSNASADARRVAELAVKMTMHELRPKASVSLDLPALPAVKADESRLTQVLVNLLANAAQAFNTNDPSANRVTISGTADGGQVSLSVSDNGPGIPPEVAPRIFDPFFTTKSIGKGTGLGLSVSHSIITALGGELRHQPTPGGGASFVVTLPAAEVSEDQPVDAGLAPLSRRARVLIIDDNEAVLKGMLRVLANEHEAVSEHDPRAAWRRFEAGERFDLVLCDLMMPYLPGPALYQRVAALDPAQATKFVFVTGGVTEPGFDAFLDGLPNQRVEKPVPVRVLRGLIREAVDAG